ncbi:uncharacterized protein LOC143342779 [Colletes latitarsis]|uniref:uncharacterized protein LOC143342779 n=1 Tax=Colletes latitarsis TaxID=2605962 RepID=UPI004036C652
MVYETLKLMPKWKRDRHTSHSSPFSIFPRSPQYELWYIRDKRLKEFAKRKVTTVECPKREETTKTNDACGLLKPPFWWKDKTTRLRSFPVGNIDDYRFEKLKESVQDTGKISERLRLDHPKKYIPGAIHRIKNPEDTSMKDTLDQADAFKVVLRMDETLPDADPSIDKCDCPARRRPRVPVIRGSKWNQCARDADKTLLDRDERWQSLCEEIDFSGTDLERQEELRKLTKPFLHDLHTWYSRNKPTKLILSVR